MAQIERDLGITAGLLKQWQRRAECDGQAVTHNSEPKTAKEAAARMTVTVENEGDGPPTTTLTGTIDQAALQDLLRRLYSLGLPLISVICVETAQADVSDIKTMIKLAHISE